MALFEECKRLKKLVERLTYEHIALQEAAMTKQCQLDNAKHGADNAYRRFILASGL